jgi:anti-sigma B factor antagonist
MQPIIEKIDDITVVTLAGDRLETSNTAELKRDLAVLLETERRVLFDLHRLQFVDSSGLGAILICSRELNVHGGKLVLCAMSKQVRALFELVRMHRVLDIYDTREEALRAFGA